MRLKILIYCLLVWIASTKCVEPYGAKVDSDNKYLVVDGRITQIEDYNKLKLSWSTTYGLASNGQPIDWAEILIFNSKGESGTYSNEGEGNYQLHTEELTGVVGESYYLEIKIDGKLYRSIPEIIPEPSMPDSISVNFKYKEAENELGNVISYYNADVFVHTKINVDGKKQYFKWNADELFSFTEIKCSPLHQPKVCFGKRETNAEEIVIFSGEQLEESYLDNILVGSKRLYQENYVEFLERHYFNVYQYSITKEAHEFWDKLLRISQPNGNIFDLPPAAVRGNIYNVDDEDELILGYFESASVEVARTYTYPFDLKPFTLPTKTSYCRTGICCNCLIIPNTTTERPDYW